MATHQKKHKKNSGNRELIFRSTKDNEDYGTIDEALGDRRFKVILTSNGKTICGKLKGSFKERVFKGDLVLVSKASDYIGCSIDEKNKYYICHKYSKDDERTLRKAGELVKIVEKVNEETSIIFEGDVVSQVQEIDVDDDFIMGL